MRRFLIILAGAVHLASTAADDSARFVTPIADAEIRTGVQLAIERNILPAATQAYYPGHFEITADGSSYGHGATWPGLDSWQMAGAYLLLGRTQLVLDYFAFVRASQREDGMIPFAIFTGDRRPNDRYDRGLKYPRDLFTYAPPQRDGLSAFALATKDWMREFDHWQPKANPFRILGTVCYILTAGEIYDHTQSPAWLKANLPSIEAAARSIYSFKSDNGLIGGSGFYTELPPRSGWDGVSQCYAIHAFREMARLGEAAGAGGMAETWAARADKLAAAFDEAFWRTDHYAEYIHIDRGLVDSHGLSDVNWAAVAFGVATGDKLKALWPRLLAEPGFHLGGVPTQTVTKPARYEEWEYNEPLPWKVMPLKDVAAMGRVWYLEAMACVRMKAAERLKESVRLVIRADRDGYWRERYIPQPDGTVQPIGAEKYCEYPAVLTRVVLGNPEIFNQQP
ncbi:MAG TPA: hypothetical protein VG936_08345 [Lacunisphaera sp.]|nr:hypothetical protein [Lacunisphaera sp.]